MKYLGYVLRNIRRNKVRTVLTIASISVCLFLMMVLISLVTVNEEVAGSLGEYDRLLTMSSQGFAQPVPIARVAEIGQMEGVAQTPEGKPAVSPFSWYGGRYKDEQIPFGQFAVDADTILTIMNEMTVAPDEARAFREDKAGCLIGRKLAQDKGVKVGDPFPLKGDIYPFNLNLTVRGVYDVPPNRDPRMCLFHWSYLDEGLKRDFQGRQAGNAGAVYIKCKDASAMPALIKKIDAAFLNSDKPTKTQTEEAFAKMFSEMAGDFQTFIVAVGIAVGVSLICVCAVAMAMSMRERTGEIAVLKAIGFGKPLVLTLVLSEAIILAGLGGVVGALGTKLFFDQFDLAKYSAGFLPFFYVPWPTAILGMGLALGIGLVSGIIPAFQAARMSVINGLRKVV